MLEEILRFAKDVIELIVHIVFHFPIASSIFAVVIGLISIILKSSVDNTYSGTRNKIIEPSGKSIIPPFDKGSYDKGVKKK